jgi:RNA polymerase sigma-70 factor (ECF subfamily)
MAANNSQTAVDQLYLAYKPLLASIAYRMLGSASEAEDAVQDVFASLSKQRDIHLEYPKAYLVKMMTNHLLNIMKSAPRNRTNYLGLWLPEPIIDRGAANGPLEMMLRRERLGYALLVLLQTCTPLERAVFVLYRSFGYSHKDIAMLLDKSEAACRKIYSRACAKIGQHACIDDNAALDESVEQLVKTFAHTLETGRFEGFMRLLTEDAVLLSDGGGVVRAAINPIKGRDRITAFFSGIAGKGSLNGDLHHVRISGQHGLLLLRDNKPPFVLAFEPDLALQAIRAVYLIVNPEKLTRVVG